MHHLAASTEYAATTSPVLIGRRILAYQQYHDDYDYDYYEEDDYRQHPQSGAKRPRPTGGRGNSDSDVKLMNLLKDKRQLGAILTGIGLLLTFMGMMLFFEGNLLRLGNISLISGIILLVGPNNVMSFFMKKSRMQASIITTFGILLVFFGKPRIGLLVEIFGLLNLFGNMFPMLLSIARNIPVVGEIIRTFDSPATAGGGGRGGGGRYPGPRQANPSRKYNNYDPDF